MRHKNLIKIFIVVIITFAKSCKFPFDTGLVKSVQEIKTAQRVIQKEGSLSAAGHRVLYKLNK